MPRSNDRGLQARTAGGLTYHERDSSVELYAYAKVLDVVKARGYHDSFYICMHLAAFSRSYKEYDYHGLSDSISSGA